MPDDDVSADVFQCESAKTRFARADTCPRMREETPGIGQDCGSTVDCLRFLAFTLSSARGEASCPRYRVAIDKP
jgi:hypothetical protein